MTRFRVVCGIDSYDEHDDRRSAEAQAAQVSYNDNFVLVVDEDDDVVSVVWQQMVYREAPFWDSPPPAPIAATESKLEVTE